MKKSNDEIDEKIRRMMLSQLPKAPRDEWFVRRVINRLPLQPQKIMSRIEWIAYALSAVILCIYWGVFFAELSDSSVRVSIHTIIFYVALSATAMSLLYSLISPIIRSNLDD